MAAKYLLSLKSKLYDHVPAAYPHSLETQELFGVEVELEGCGGISSPSPAVFDYWSSVNDGSLRKFKPGDEAIEYVTRGPYNRTKVIEAVKYLCDFLNQPDKTVYDSYRTSIHIHVNCLADTLLHIYNFITLCLLFDELLTSQNGDHRIGNNFCLRAKDAQGQVVELTRCIEKHGHLLNINPHIRYSSINFASLNKFGTIEFRSLECTTDPLRIAHWIRTIDYLKQASRTFQDPQDIIRRFSQMGPEDFTSHVLGPQANKYTQVPEYKQMLFEGMRLAQEFAFCSDWQETKAIPQKKGKKNFPDFDVFDQYVNMVDGGGPQMEVPAPMPAVLNWVNNEDGWHIVEGEDGWHIVEGGDHAAVQAPGNLFGEVQPAYAPDVDDDDDIDDDDFWIDDLGEEDDL